MTNIQNAIISAYNATDLNAFYADSVLVKDFSAAITSIIGSTTISSNGVTKYVNTDMVDTAKNAIVSALVQTQFDLNNVGNTNQTVANSM